MSTRRSQIVTMGFPDRGEENLMRQTSRCKNFQPNMFNKTKCQNCFRTREAHDLGDDDGSNKPKKALQYGYLFVAPGIDFDNPMSRNRKWQRRCFILYENGELCYSLDFDPNAIPQGVVNMYEVVNVFTADQLTGHPFSIGIATPDDNTYIRAETREEKDSWYDTLIEYPAINQENAKQKKKKRGIFPMPMPGSKDSEKPEQIEEQAEAKPDLPPAGDDPLSELDDLVQESRDKVGPVGNTTRDTTDIYTASSKAARKEKSNLRRSHSALEQRPEKYEKKQQVRRTPSVQTAMTTSSSQAKTTHSSPRKDKEERSSRRHTTAGDRQESGMTGKGDAVKQTVTDGSSHKYSSSSMRHRPSESGLADLERELRQNEAVSKTHRESLPAQPTPAETTLHKNNNNVYKDLSPRSSPTHLAAPSSRKSSMSDRSASPDSQSTTDSQSKKSETNSQSLLSQEELQRMDVPKRGRFRFNKTLIEGETQSPSKRTIERRRHAQERRNRHTLDGSTVPFPISERKDKSENQPRLKRSNSDPNLADNEEVKRKEIAETFPGLLHLKNGWLMKQDAEHQEWNKYWFVLRDNKLSYFKDSSDESVTNLAGAIDLAWCIEATETTASRNYGFQVKMRDATPHNLGAMTSGIRANWIHAINKAIPTAQEASPEINIQQPEPVTEVDATPPPPIKQQTPDVIPTPPPKQDNAEPARSSLSIDLTSRHRKASTDSRISETSSPTTEREPVFHERQGSIRSKERRSRRSSRSEDIKSQKTSTPKAASVPSSTNGRSSSTSSEVFETPPNTPTPVELRIDEPVVRKSSFSSTRSERTSVSERPVVPEDLQLSLQKIEADSLRPEHPQGDPVHPDTTPHRTSLGSIHSPRQPSLDHDGEQKALVSQLETVVKKLSQVELQNQTLHMEVKQARNASELLKHEKEELQDELHNSADALGKRDKECETLHSRFEKLVADFQESETEVSKARSSLKTERDKAVTMIERLRQQMEVIEGEKKEYKERAKKVETDFATQSKTMRHLEKNQEESQKLFKKLMSKMESYKQRLEGKGDEASAAKVQQLEKERSQMQEVNIQLQTRLQELEQELKKKSADSQTRSPRLETDSEVETELADLRMELSERDEQIEQLSEQLETEFSEKAQLQAKYDVMVADSALVVLEGQGDKARSAGPSDQDEKIKDALRNIELLQAQLTSEASRRKQAEEKLNEEVTERQTLIGRVQELDAQLHIAMEEREHSSKANEDTKNLMELLQGKNKEVERLQSEMKRIEADRVSLMQQFGTAQADLDALKKQVTEQEDSKATLQGDLECVLQSKLDLEESAKQTTTELITVKSELELLRKASQSASSAAEEEARRVAAKKENQILQAQVEKVQAMYTEDMFKKEQLLETEHEKYEDLQRKFANLQSKLTQKEEDLAVKEQESKTKLQEMTEQMEQLGQKVERSEKEMKRMRTELKSSQDNYDALEIKHMQSAEEAKQQQKSQQEQLELMGRRIQDLTSKLGTAERKLVGAAASATKPAVTSDTSDTSDSPSSDGAEGGPSKIKILESRLVEMEKKLKEVTHRLVDVTTRELEKRKAYQTKCVSENRLKDQVRGLQREVLALRQQMEKQLQSDELVQAQQRRHSEAMEEMRRSHRREVEEREAEARREREQEDAAVNTAISALKKAYEVELEKEKRMSQESYPKDVESIMKRHREVVSQMNKDWLILSQKFSEQCRENSMLSKALRAMQRSQKEAHEKLQRAQVENRQKVVSLEDELARMQEEEDDEEDDEEEEESDEEEEEEEDGRDVKMLQMRLRLRELELDMMKEEVETLRRTGPGSAEGAQAQAQAHAGSHRESGAGETSRRGSWNSKPESDGATRPKGRRSLSDLTHRSSRLRPGDASYD